MKLKRVEKPISTRFDGMRCACVWLVFNLVYSNGGYARTCILYSLLIKFN